jgi:hypothetical protein
MPRFTRAGNKDKHLSVVAGVTKRRYTSRKPNPPTPTPLIDFDEDVKSSRGLNDKDNSLMRFIPSITEAERQRAAKSTTSAANLGIRFTIHRRLTSVIPETQYTVFSSIESSVKRDKIDKMEENETEMIKIDVSFAFQCKFLYRKKIVKNNFHDIKAISSFDFVKWMKEVEMYINRYPRQRKKLYLNLTIKTSAISTVPGVQKTMIPLTTIFLQRKVKYWLKEMYPFQVYDNQKAAFSQEDEMP